MIKSTGIDTFRFNNPVLVYKQESLLILPNFLTFIEDEHEHTVD